MHEFISETARQGALFICFVVVFAAFEEKKFPSFHFLKRFMHTALESQLCNLWCHQDELPGAAAWTTNQTLCRFIQCLLELSHTTMLHLAVALWVLSYGTECSPLSPENQPGCCLCHAFHFCLVILKVVHLHCVIRGVQGGVFSAYGRQ